MSEVPSIFTLIHSLSPAEKSYVKKYAIKGDSRDNTYLKLFDLIAKQKVYDEVYIKSKFKGQKILKNFAASKKYLFKLILNSMINYHSKNPKIGIMHNYAEMFFLIDKGLRSDAFKIAKKIDNDCHKYDLEFLRSEAISKRIGLLPSDINNRSEYNELLESLDQNLVWQNRYLALQKRNKEAKEAMEEFGPGIRKINEIKKIKKMMADDILVESHSANPFLHYLRNHTLIILNQILNDQDVAQELVTDLKTLMDNNPEHRTVEFNKALKVYGAYIQALSMNNNSEFDLIRSENTKLLEMLNSKNQVLSSKQKDNIINQTNVNMCVACIIQNKDKLGGKYALKVHDFLKSNTFEYTYFHTFQYRTIIISYFHARMFDNALDAIQEFENIPEFTSLDQLYSHIKLWKIMIHYEKGNDELVKHLIRNYYREIKKKDLLHKGEKLMLKYAKKLCSVGKSDRVKYFKYLYEDLYEQKDDVEIQNFIRHFYLLEWTKKHAKIN